MSPFTILVITIIYYVLANEQGSSQYFVEPHGIDDFVCGNKTYPCGTLFWVSRLVGQTPIQNEEIEIIVDGQNDSTISEYRSMNNLKTDPCIPLPFPDTKIITFTFTSSIHELNDWYPQQICNTIAQNKHYNESYYIFQGGMSLTFNNLIINDYTITNDTTTYFPIWVSYFNASITCNNCVFNNITNLMDKYGLICTKSSVYLFDNRFSNIKTSGNVIYAYHNLQYDWAIRRFTIQNASFRNIFSDQSILNITPSSLDIGTDGLPELLITDCNFQNISVQNAIIHDGSLKNLVNIHNTQIAIDSGSIYFPKHTSESNIFISNISVLTNQLTILNECNEYLDHWTLIGLFNFGSLDIIYIDIMSILYLYNMSESCIYYGPYRWNISFALLNTIVAVSECKIPAKAIHNAGNILLNDVTIDVEIVSSEYPDYLAYVYEYFYNYGSLIENEGVMHITNMNIERACGYSLFANRYILSVSNLSMEPILLNADTHDPNALQPTQIIYQSGLQASLTIENSNLIGTRPLYVRGGTVKISNSVFQFSKQAMIIMDSEQLMINNCEIRNNGRWNGPWYYDITYVTAPIMIESVRNIEIINNNISGFDPHGFLVLKESSKILLKDNEMHVDASYLFYDISEKDKYFTLSPVYITWCSNTTIVNNYFGENILDPLHPSLYYRECGGVNCLSGNTFFNDAVQITSTNVTSCFRPALIEYAAVTSTQQIYGSMEKSLYDEIGYFFVTLNHDAILGVFNGTVALDNINITVLKDNISNPAGVLNIAKKNISSSSTILLVDSVITKRNNVSYDIAYDKSDCEVINNDRLFDNAQYIAKLLIGCVDYKSDGHVIWNKTIDSQKTNYVDHLSPISMVITPMNITAKNFTYYPGQLLTLTYEIADRIGNVINYNSLETEYKEIVVHLEGESFSTDLTIDSHGICEICHSGVLINVVTIKKQIGTVFTLNVSVVNDILYPINFELPLNIIGCAVGYGPESNNATCVMCNTGSYNLVSDNLQQCKSCEQNKNTELMCIDGTIYVASNGWIGSVDNNIVSSICPTNYCCQDPIACNYMEDTDLLCAQNRNYTSVLCGKCKHGYSESINSSQCVKCTQTFYALYLLFPFLLAAVIFVFIVGSNVDTIHDKKDHLREDKQGCKKIRFVLRNDYSVMMIKIMFFKNTMYYEQGIAQALSGGIVQILFYSLASIFNLSSVYNSMSNDGNAWCFIAGLNAKQKIVADLVSSIFVVIMIGILHLTSYCLCKKGIQIKNKKINFGKSWISTFLIVIGNVISVLFKLLSCSKVAAYHVHKYFGHEKCYGVTWILSLIALMIIIIAFSIIFIKLYFMTNDEKQNKNHPLSGICNKYQPQWEYYEFILFIRRVIIAMFAVSINDILLKSVFIATMFLFVYIHYKYQPFIVQEANEMEFILLLCFIFIIILQLASAINELFVNIVTSLLIILPFLLMNYYFWRVVKSKMNECNMERKNDSASSLIECVEIEYGHNDDTKSQQYETINQNDSDCNRDNLMPAPDGSLHHHRSLNL